MFCPKCGAAAQKENAYCKRCGVWLARVGGPSYGRGAQTPEERLGTMLVFNAVSAVFGLFAALALALTYFGREGAKWSIYLAFAFCLVIAVHQTINFFFALELKRRLGRGRRAAAIDESAAPADDLLGAPTSPRLGAASPQSFIPVPSVTEETTNLLDAVPHRSSTIINRGEER